jgi:hypothetical protein
MWSAKRHHLGDPQLDIIPANAHPIVRRLPADILAESFLDIIRDGG